MARFIKFQVWQEARVLLQVVSAASADMRVECDLKAQIVGNVFSRPEA